MLLRSVVVFLVGFIFIAAAAPVDSRRDITCVLSSEDGHYSILGLTFDQLVTISDILHLNDTSFLNRPASAKLAKRAKAAKDGKEHAKGGKEHAKGGKEHAKGGKEHAKEDEESESGEAEAEEGGDEP